MSHLYASMTESGSTRLGCLAFTLLDRLRGVPCYTVSSKHRASRGCDAPPGQGPLDTISVLIKRINMARN
jgi:hypothetical protein